MKCEQCNSEMELTGFDQTDSDFMELDYIWDCKCGHRQFSPKMRVVESKGSTIREPFKINWIKVKDFNELIWLLNECDLWVHNPHPKYNELKERFS